MKNIRNVFEHSWVQFAVAIGLAEGIGALSSAFTASAIPTWYVTLIRPSFAPPSWVFGPVWAILFATMGVSVCLIWRQRKQRKNVRQALDLFGMQFALNVLWPVLFFGMQNPGAAFVEIIVLWFAILFTVVTFVKISRLAAWLLVPYLLWVSFATVLNYAFWMLN